MMLDAPSVSPSFERRRRFMESVMHYVFLCIGLLTVALLIGIFAFLLMSAVRTFGEVRLFDFLLGSKWNPSALREPLWGILPLFLSTAMVAFGALLVAVPFGLSLAIYLSYIASPRVREVLKPIVEMIAGVPSVVLGLLGLIYLAPAIAKVFELSNGLNALCASILVGITAVPTIASLCEDALSSVPRSLNDASLALGATEWKTIHKVMVPAALSGIAAAIMLGLGRAIGETMVVLMVAGNSLQVTGSFLDPVRPMTATIAIEIREVVVGNLHWNALFAVGLTLFVVTFLINTLTDIFIRRQVRL